MLRIISHYFHWKTGENGDTKSMEDIHDHLIAFKQLRYICVVNRSGVTLPAASSISSQNVIFPNFITNHLITVSGTATLLFNCELLVHYAYSNTIVEKP